MYIATQIKEIRSQISPGVKLMCVSKMQPKEAILEAYNCGERIFGESKVQELCQKKEELPSDIQWHFIGHLQTNKIKHIAPFVSLIHGVDSEKLLSAINKQGEKIDRELNCLLQVHIAQEETKFGFSEEELLSFLNSGAWKKNEYAKICGLMGMATFTKDEQQLRKEFGALKQLFDKIKTTYFSEDNRFKEISMGMSDDYQIAIEQGSTLIRVGSSIFGNRN